MSTSPRISRRNAIRGAVLVGVGAAAGGGALLTTNVAQADVARPTIAGTAEWGARAPRGLTQLPNNANKIVIHHTASSNTTGTTQQDAYNLAYQIQGWHMDPPRNWADSGQHFTISRGGYIMEGRHTSLQHLDDGNGMVQGAHAPGANTDGIGIENEGTFTSILPPDELWNSMVDFCAYVCVQYGIPATEIYGHRDFVATACPGDALYAKLPQLREEVQAKLDGGGDPPGFSVIVDNTSEGFTAGAAWATSTYSDNKHGADYKFADPADEPDEAKFAVEIPADGEYKVETWYPSVAGYNTATPFIVYAASGAETVVLNQATGGGRWVDLGTHTLTAGTHDVVGVSRQTGEAGYVIADAVRVSEA
ncbi:MAG TPA: N-acetylmuramoyl-L-alanine amidase [Candidatus Stackebrandtia excrementipullorum]|nr:N-acetylmuramoyl-L-alanine amidase [Candidatus Stackebrandtia excrementipullorum]